MTSLPHESVSQNKKPLLILASASPRRLELLAQIGIVPDRVIPADLDETPRKGELPRLYAKRLAHEKAALVASQCQEPALILGADTVVAVGRRILQKAEDEDTARRHLTLLSGRRHKVFTAIALYPSAILPDSHVSERVVESYVTFTNMQPHHIDSLIAQGDWRGKAGSYALQGAAASYIRQMGGSPSAVIGLPLFETAQLLRGQPSFRVV
ncbi:Maf family protein [Aristophania vespae]|uniref:Maf family protein n=1 Tax=Aristophania vespae TaxID=2697033 RepID=UPI0023513D90|nr:Maf family protein [Aristophania vespae]UMM64005.1 dTTP/UTP pyrophosphatase [Aristophania vespae]